MVTTKATLASPPGVKPVKHQAPERLVPTTVMQEAAVKSAFTAVIDELPRLKVICIMGKTKPIGALISPEILESCADTFQTLLEEQGQLVVDLIQAVRAGKLVVAYDIKTRLPVLSTLQILE